MSDKKPIQIISETEDTVTMSKTQFEALLEELEDAEDSIALLRYGLTRVSPPELLPFNYHQKNNDWDKP